MKNKLKKEVELYKELLSNVKTFNELISVTEAIHKFALRIKHEECFIKAKTQ
jgi:hypothetical protein